MTVYDKISHGMELKAWMFADTFTCFETVFIHFFFIYSEIFNENMQFLCLSKIKAYILNQKC